MNNKTHPPYSAPEWLAMLETQRAHTDLLNIQQAIALYTTEQQSLLSKALTIADILLSLGLDNETLAAALLYPLLQTSDIHLDFIVDHFSESHHKLLRDVMQMQSLSKLQQLNQQRHHQQIENLRKMLLAMMTDVRAVLIILAERLWQLREAKQQDLLLQQQLAHETLDIYAPLANRLGIWQLKWEMEDLCLRFLKPEIYQKIAKWLAVRRVEREAYVNKVINILNDMIKKTSIKQFQVTGRVKHIYSIYHKMCRKGMSFENIYDCTAVRVLVPTIMDCYNLFGILQNTWQQIPDEFDDYIAHPKANGYRSIHMVIHGPEQKIIEVQIRTYDMHQESELGVAAHWRYKEGVLQTSDYEAKIALLRQIMAWQKEVANGSLAQTALTDASTASTSLASAPLSLASTSLAPTSASLITQTQDLFADSIYVFTPGGDVIDLPKEATPLDFAYYIHSEVGHRCRGAKINGNIATLTSRLQTGDRVEILTAKEAGPSRDWLNPHYGYLKTSRARAKVQHWFRVHDAAEGSATESRTTSAHAGAGHGSAGHGVGHGSGGHASAGHGGGAGGGHGGVGHGGAGLGAGPGHHHATGHVVQGHHAGQAAVELANAGGTVAFPLKREIKILGMSKLLTHFARCCHPNPGDAIVGYITQARGVSIHQTSCSNIKNIQSKNPQRVIEVEWE